jgi:hypothetical protein
MRKTSFALLACLAVLAFTVGPRSTALAGPVAATPAIAFGVSTQVDPQRFVTEPGLALDPQGNVWTSGPWGFSTGQSFLWRSLDHGDSYDLEKLEISPVGLRPCSTPIGPGGGDTDQIAFTSVAGQHVVMFVDLEALAGVLTCTSFDGGNTWFVQNILTTTQQAEGGADRMWLAHDVLGGVDVEYLFNDDLVSGGDAVYRTTDFGANWEVVSQPAFTQAVSIGNPGGIAVDPATHAIYLANSDDDRVVVGVGQGALTGPLTFTEVTVATMAQSPYPADLVRIALDLAGNIYLSWLEPADDSVRLSVSTDHGASWSAPRTVSPAGTRGVFTSVVAGSVGRVALAWYGTTNPAPLAENSGPWFIYFAQSLAATGVSPTFSVTRATPHAIHVNPVCVQGLNCTAVQPADRNLGDFMSIQIDSAGAAFIAYNDTANQLFDPAQTSSAGAPNVHIVRQTGGPSLIASVGSVSPAAPGPITGLAAARRASDKSVVDVSGRHGLGPGNYAVDGAGDAYWPKQGTVGPNVPKLDLRSARLAADATGLHARIEVADASAIQITAAGGNAWMIQWWFGNALYYAKADETTSGVVCSAGAPASVFSSSGNGKAAFYFGAPNAPCRIDLATNTIVIDVPQSSVGEPGPGATLHEATGYSFRYDVPDAFMDQVDATAPFSYVVGDGATVRGRVEIALDDPGFAAPVVASLAGGTFSAVLTGVKGGKHIVYAREVVDGVAFSVTSVTIPK